MDYGIDVWSPWLKRDIHSIESVQRRATNLVPGLVDLSYQEMLTRLKLPSMVYRRKRGEMIQVYKFLRNIWNIKEPPLGVSPEQGASPIWHKGARSEPKNR